VREDSLKIANLTSVEQVDQVKDIICGITGARFIQADLDDQIIDFELVEDLDDLTLTTIQCDLRDNGFEAGEVVEGSTCTVRFRSK
jgi:hypothetical protein